MEGVAVIYLKGSFELARSRLLEREGHYIKDNLLQSQFDALEEPENAVVLDVSMPAGKMLETMLMRYPTLKRFVK
jgi:gluconokinase